MFKHILIATDGSPLAHKAAKAGVALAGALGSKVTAYYALPQFLASYGDGIALDRDTIDAIEVGARKAGQKHVDAIGMLAKRAGVPCVSLISEAFTAYEGIVGAAKKGKCDAIVIASHGRRGLSRLMMGSVTQKVLTHSKIPVVVYR